MATALEILNGVTFQDTTDKQYDNLRRYVNVTSYSMLSVLHACPREFQLSKSSPPSILEVENVHFAFGHAVGAGIQNWMATRDMDQALFNSMLAWRIPFDAKIEKKKKSIWEAWLAVQKFPEFYMQNLEEWEVLVLPNGKSALELSIGITFPNNYRHYVHIDTVLVNKRLGKLAICENKTVGYNDPDSALYGNSTQALSYAVIIDALGMPSDYEVFYCVYAVPKREWQLMPFSKSSTHRAEWLLDVRLDHAAISTYREMNFFPKRGESCWRFSRRCQYFGECNIVNSLPPFNVLPEGEHAEKCDYYFTFEEIAEAQRRK